MQPSLPSRPARRARWAAWTLLLGAGLTGLGGCGGTAPTLASDGSPATHGSPHLCPEPPHPVTPRALDVPLSELGVSISVDVPALLDALHRELPVVVADAERRPIGAPGLLSYTIRRSPLSLTQTEASLVLRATLSGEVHICKPFAGACITYGVCEPRWEVTGKLAREFETLSDWLPQLEVKLTEGCSLRPVGYDASSILLQHTEREAAKVSVRLERAFNAGLSELDKGWRRAHDTASASPWRLPALAEGLRYRPLRLTGDTLSGAAAWRGQLSPPAEGAVDLTAAPHAPPFPALSAREWQRQERLVPKTRWISSTLLSYQALAQQLSAAWQLQSNVGPRQLQLVATEQQGQAVLVVGLPSNDGCAWSWLPVTPTLLATTATSAAPGLRLVPIPPAHGRPPDPGAHWLNTQTFDWTPQSGVPQGAARELARRELAELSAMLEPRLRAAHLRLAIEPLTQSHEIRLGPGGLSLVTAVDTDIQLIFAP